MSREYGASEQWQDFSMAKPEESRPSTEAEHHLLEDRDLVFEYGCDTQSDLMKGKVASFVESRALGSEIKPFGLYIIEGSKDEAAFGRAVEGKRFWDRFKNDPQEMAAEYGPYESQSIFLTVLDQKKMVPAGTMRIITPGQAGLKSVVDLEKNWGKTAEQLLVEDGFDASRGWDVGTLAVEPDYQGGAENRLATSALYYALRQYSRVESVPSWIMIGDAPVMKLLRRLGYDLRDLRGVEPRYYLGSELSVPAVAHLDTFDAKVAQVNPRMLEVITTAKGLTDSYDFDGLIAPEELR